MAYVLLVTVTVSAKTMTFKDVMKESNRVKKNITSAKSLEQKKDILKKWEAKLQETLKSYEEENPKEGTSEEDLVSKYQISMEPVFDIVKDQISKVACVKAVHQIELEDRDNTKKDPSLLSSEAKEALAILKLFCK
tara:strand:- start:83969 stop:84376 length:408 start_codon:yes stop_codon:yes gene_type:complete